MRALHAAFLCGVAFLVGRQSTLAPVECSRPAARRLLMFNGGKRHGKGRGRGGKGRGYNGKREKRARFEPVTLGDGEQRRQEHGVMRSLAAGRCISDVQAASFFRAHRSKFLDCAGDERRVIAALALLSPDANKVIVDVTAHVETMGIQPRLLAPEAPSVPSLCIGLTSRGTRGGTRRLCSYESKSEVSSSTRMDSCPRPLLIPQVGANRGFTTMAVFAAWGQLVERQVSAVHATIGRGWHKAGCGMSARELAAIPRVVAFEPDPNNYAMLSDAAAVVLNHTAAAKMAAISPERLTLVNAAVGKAEGIVRFDSAGESGGINSRSRTGGVAARLVRLDDEVPRLGLGERVHLVKSDLEGFDPDAMYGAERLLRSNAIDLWYYEYHGKGLFIKQVRPYP